MSKMYTKIQAFTLTEMMVVIVISAIVAGLAFTILDVVQKNMRSIESNYEHQSEIQALEVALTVDFTKYPEAYWDARTETLLLSSPINTQEYRFQKDSITTPWSSFVLKTKNTELFFEGKRVTNGEIDAIKLTFENARDLHRIFVYKYKDPTNQF